MHAFHNWSSVSLIWSIWLKGDSSPQQSLLPFTRQLAWMMNSHLLKRFQESVEATLGHQRKWCCEIQSWFTQFSCGAVQYLLVIRFLCYKLRLLHYLCVLWCQEHMSHLFVHNVTVFALPFPSLSPLIVWANWNLISNKLAATFKYKYNTN